MLSFPIPRCVHSELYTSIRFRSAAPQISSQIHIHTYLYAFVSILFYLDLVFSGRRSVGRSSTAAMVDGGCRCEGEDLVERKSGKYAELRDETNRNESKRKKKSEKRRKKSG